MNRCFVVQPFDNDKYDQRYKEIFKPAIEEAGLIPYRIDEDPGVRIPIESIENGILNSTMCFAEISTDNPNVWYELGFAAACRKDIILVCSNERTTNFPFDIQHKQIITYKTNSKGDFEELHQNITNKIKAYIENPSVVRPFFKNTMPGQEIIIDSGNASGHSRLAEIEEKKLKLSVKPKIRYNGSGTVGYNGELDIDLINKGETAVWLQINLLAGDIQLHSLSIPWEMEKDTTRKIFGRSNGKKNITDTDYEIELIYSDALENEYRLIIKGHGANAKIISDDSV